MSAFGTKFILVSDVQQELPTKIFQGGKWVHLATIKRGLDEYVCVKNALDGKVYIEEITSTGSFKHIADDKLWKDLTLFLTEQGVIGIDRDKEFKVGTTMH